MKLQIKRALNSIGFDIVRYVPLIERPFAVLPHLVRVLVEAGDDFFFIQIGANDGLRADPLRSIVFAYNLHGLLVEPLPDMFASLQKNYAGTRGLRFENAAVADKTGPKTLFRVRADSDVPDGWHGCASFSRDHLLRQGIPSHMITHDTVLGLTYDDLLQKHKITRISLLQVDAEGYDHAVLRAALRSGIKPALINFEHVNLSPAQRHYCKTLLVENNYSFLEVGPDTLAVLDTALPATAGNPRPT